MSARLRLSLLWTYALAFSAVVCLLLLAGGAMQALLIWRGSLASVTQAQRAHAGHAAAEIGGFVARAQQALQPIVDKFGWPDASTVGGDRAAATLEAVLRIEMAALLRQRPEIGALRWIAEDGRERVALRRVGLEDADRGYDWRNDALWQQARAAGVAVGEVQLRSGSEPHVSVAAAAGAVLVAELNLTFVRDVVARVSPAAGVAYVVDRHGGLIAHPQMNLVLARADVARLPQVRAALEPLSTPARGEAARDLNGQAVLASSATVPGLDWRVLVEEPRAQALAPVVEALRQSLGLVALGLAAAVLAGLALARRIVRPILRIESKARDLADGRFDSPIEPAGGAELQSLAVQFNRMAARLQGTLAEQERRIAERTRELAESNEAKTRFIDVASHDLRQPVHAIGLLAELLGEAAVNGKAGRIAARIADATQDLSRLVDALLDLSQLDRGTVHIEPRPIALRPLVSRVVARNAPEAEAKGLALAAVPTSAWVHSDPLQLERILGNLLSNAVRYTAEGRVLVGCRRRRGDEASGGMPRIELIVADTGRGIESQDLPLVMREFWRAGRGARGGDGLGLGLAIVERLAHLLGHRFWLSSEPGRGTLAHLLLPRVLPQQGPADHAPHGDPFAGSSLAGREVLVVDDDALTREALGDLMARWGCRVRTAATAASAIEQAAGVQIVLCDLDLRDVVDGVDLVQQLRAAHGPMLRCAFVSGAASPELLARARATGLLLATKPVAPARMRSLLEHLAARQA